MKTVRVKEVSNLGLKYACHFGPNMDQLPVQWWTDGWIQKLSVWYSSKYIKGKQKRNLILTCLDFIKVLCTDVWLELEKIDTSGIT